MSGLQYLPSEGRPPCAIPTPRTLAALERMHADILQGGRLMALAAAGQATPAARRLSSRRSTSDKTGQATRRRWRELLIKRYGPICHICLAAGLTDQRALIDLELKWPDPRCFTRDHIRPRSQGGKDTIRNQRPAHKVCNERRGAKSLENVTG